MAKKKLGKVATNEELKITAAFANNTGVGVMLGGAFIPLFGFYQRLPEIPSLSSLIAGFTTILLAAGLAGYLHYLALIEIRKIQD